MGKLDVFEIILDHPQAIYYPGQTVSGRLNVTLNQPMEMRGIRLHFHGGASVHWSERHTTGSGDKRRTVTRHYRNSQTYFNMVSYVFGKAEGQSGPNPEHPVGPYSYPFQFILPQNLPSSFEGFHGNVRFFLKGTIDKPWKFDHHCKRPIMVISILDLNLQPNVTQAQGGQNQKTLCCLCCKSGPISADFHLDRRGYVPGEFVVVNGEISNLSNRRMVSSSVRLIMSTQYIATTKSRTWSKTVSKIDKGEIAPGGSEVWSGERLYIPPLPPSLLPNCDIIRIFYSVVLNVSPSGPAFDLQVPLEVIIGTVPLANITSVFASAPPSYTLSYGEAEESNFGAPPQVAPANPDMMPPPPSYAECVLGKVDLHEEEDNEYTRGEMNWAPSYPYYNWSNPQ